MTDRRDEQVSSRRELDGSATTTQVVSCVVACIDVEPVQTPKTEPLDHELFWNLAVERAQRRLRPDDRVCVIGDGRIAVCFGQGAHQATVEGLGLRLAWAMGDHLNVGGRRIGMKVRVGIATGPPEIAADVASNSIKTARALPKRPSSNGSFAYPSDSTHVVVSYVPEAAQGLRLTKREVLARRGDRPVHPSFSMSPIFPDGSDDPLWVTDLSVLVVALEPMVPHKPSTAVEGLLATSRRIGVAPDVAITPDPAALMERVSTTCPDVVVFAMPSEAASRNLSANGCTPWEKWAKLTKELVRSGTVVMAVGVGASAASIATCVREGAVGLLDLGEFAEQLEKINVNAASRRLAAENGSRDAARSAMRSGLPHPYNRLVELTTSEHRVLYHMTRGASASDIAEDLIVSLATVRSHIRSILRKLQVSSQLAAVALANGTQPDLTEAV